ncbi:MAG: hypothetical protein EA385_00020 [Salinarimonadaceae bacterium]|nr:MAG: hypothetical protein EA385_00020 [Salinarimonadaceae bacterium]
MQFFATAALYVFFGLAAAALWTGWPLDFGDWTVWALILLWPLPLAAAVSAVVIALLVVLDRFDSRGGPRDG